MPFNNQGQQEKYPVQTSSLIFFGDNVMMQMKFSDNLCIIAFRDAKIDENGKRTYPRPSNGDKDTSAVLTRDKAATFLRRIQKNFIPTFESYLKTRLEDPSFNKGFSVGVPTNREMTNIITIATGKPESGPYVPEVSYYGDIDPTTKLPKVVKTIRFNDFTPVVIDYDGTTGEYAAVEPDYPQVVLFMMALDEFVRGQCKGRLHEINELYSDRYYKLRGTVNQIAIKNGIQVETGNNFQNKTYTPSQPSSAPVLELKPIDGGLSDFMATAGVADSPF